MLTAYATVLAFALVAWALVFISAVAWRLSGPARAPAAGDSEPPSTLDERTLASGPFNFNPRLLVVALLAVVLEALLALLFPAVVVFRRLVADGHGKRTLVEIFLVLAVFLLALAYAWKKKDLDWERERAP